MPSPGETEAFGPRALVLGGGGMRGAFASGAAHAMAEMGLRFDAVYGTSVGGAVAAWFTAGQTAEGLTTWRYARDPACMNYRRWLTGRGPLIDLKHLYQHVYLQDIGLDLDGIRKADHPAYVTVVDVETGFGRVLDLRRVDIPAALMATSALPFVTDGPFAVAGREYMDGGFTDPVPIRYAIEHGAKDITVVLNHAPGPGSPDPAALVWLIGRRWPALEDPARRHRTMYDEAEDVIRSPPTDVRFRVVRPTAPLPLGRFTRDMDRIDRGIAAGQTEARHAFT